jgi:hypothetical protein
VKVVKATEFFNYHIIIILEVQCDIYKSSNYIIVEFTPKATELYT